MKDQDKTKSQLISELEELRGRVAEHKRVEDDLRQSEWRYRHLAESIPHPVGHHDPDGKVIDCNLRWTEYTGQTLEEAQGNGWMKAVHPDDVERVGKAVQEAIAGGESYQCEYRLRRKSDGSYRWHLAKAVPHRDANGTILSWFSSVIDIDDQKRAEEALRQSEQRFSLHFQQTPLAAIDWDVEGRVTKWNPVAEQIFGYSQEEALGRHVSFIVPPSARDHVAHIVDELRDDKGGYRSRNENVTKDGRTILCEWYNTPLIDAEGQSIGAASLAQDITEQRQAEEALRESELRFRTLFRDSVIGKVVVAPCGKFIQANPAFCEFLGYSEHEIIGKNSQSVTHPDDWAASSDAVQRHFASGSRIERLDKRYLHKSGRAIWGEVSSTMIYDREGKPSYLIAQVVDIGERKRAEQALQQAHAELERRVEERTSELRKANEQLAIFQQFAEASGQGFSMADLNGHLLYVNPALCRMLDEDTPQESLGQHVSIYYPDEVNRTRETERFPSLMRDGYWQGELPMLSRKGKVIPTWHNTFLIRDESGNPFRIGVVITNITERKRAEEAAKKLLRAVDEERGRLQAIIDSLPVGLWIADATGKMTLINDTARTIWGGTAPCAEKTEDYGVYKAWWADTGTLIVADEMPMVRSLCGETFKEVLMDFERFDGTRGTQLVSSTPIRTGDGTVIGSVAIAQDITERQQAQEALRQSHSQLRAIYDGMVEGLLITDIDTKRFVRVNSSMCRMLGYSAEELLAASIKDIHPPEEVSNDLARFQAAAEGRVSINEDRPVRRKDGSIFYADITGHRILYEGRPCLLALFRDITERKQTQEALRQSHEELRAIHDQVVDGIIIVNAETWNPVQTNPAFCRMLGYTQEEVHTISPDQIHPADVLPAVREHCLAANEGAVTRIDELPFLRKDGRTIYADVVSTPIFYNGRRGWISFFHDVTERRQARVALERERRTLEHMLRASDHERQLIAYDIHDGLAQYLTGAMMQLEHSHNIREDRPKDSETAYKAGMEMLHHCHFEARRLISGVRPPILDESGVAAAIAHLVYEVRSQNGPKVEFHGKVDFGRLAPTLENSIYRITQEALTNACKYSQSRKVSVGLVQRGDQVRISVRDQGIGFDPKTVGENRFGLEGIRERARLLGGKAVIDSTPGKGTRIVVDLPIVLRKENNE